MLTEGNIGKTEASYINHIAHIQNIPNPDQIQYMNFTHAVAWSFNKDQKCNKKIYNILIYQIILNLN